MKMRFHSLSGYTSACFWDQIAAAFSSPDFCLKEKINFPFFSPLRAIFHQRAGRNLTLLQARQCGGLPRPTVGMFSATAQPARLRLETAQCSGRAIWFPLFLPMVGWSQPGWNTFSITPSGNKTATGRATWVKVKSREYLLRLTCSQFKSHLSKSHPQNQKRINIPYFVILQSCLNSRQHFWFSGS